jgi:exopolysaccharide biosynthesis polyprenyl glycosylphosphotransferase
MIQQQVYLLNTFLMFLDAGCVIAAGYSAFFTKKVLSEWLWNMDGMVFISSILIVMVMNNFVMERVGLYSERRQPTMLALNSKIAQSVFIDFTILISVVFVMGWADGYSRAFMTLFALYTVLFIALERTIINLYYKKNTGKKFHARKILVTGDSKRSETVIRMLKEHVSLGHDILGFLPVEKGQEDVPSCPNMPGTIKNLPEILKKNPVDDVIFSLGPTRAVNLNTYIRICEKMGITAKILPAMWEAQGRKVSVERYLDIPFLTVNSTSLNISGMMYKRILDIAGSLLGIVILGLIYPFVAVALKRESPAPVLFKQKRKGQHGRVFEIYKFRTMVPDAEQQKKELMAQNEMNGAMFKLSTDPRTTPVGRWLRKTSIDEIPQFINVLKGEMSLVGTRPPTLDEVENYQLDHFKRISMKPGITGLWQVSGRNKITDFEQIVALDNKYIDEWCFLNDIKILFKTLYVVLKRKGAM